MHSKIYVMNAWKQKISDTHLHTEQLHIVFPLFTTTEADISKKLYAHMYIETHTPSFYLSGYYNIISEKSNQ